MISTNSEWTTRHASRGWAWSRPHASPALGMQSWGTVSWRKPGLQRMIKATLSNGVRSCPQNKKEIMKRYKQQVYKVEFQVDKPIKICPTYWYQGDSHLNSKWTLCGTHNRKCQVRTWVLSSASAAGNVNQSTHWGTVQSSEVQEARVSPPPWILFLMCVPEEVPTHV